MILYYYYCGDIPREMKYALSAALATAVAARVGDGWGTNIHWTTETAAGELAMLSKAFRIARMDFDWGSVESTCGSYDFSAYDGLLTAMEGSAIRPYWILDYGNPACYPPTPGTPPQSCDTPACIAGFGRLAAATVNHFKGHNIIFECLNEPNGMGGDNATDITALCLAAGASFTAADELFVGPTTAGVDLAYMQAAFEAGILDAFSAVSVHPYRSTPPDTVFADYASMRELIAASSPDKAYPIISGEWGYTSAELPCQYGNRVDENTQAQFLARMWLSNLVAGVNISIAYDWRDDGKNATNCEFNFGSVRAVGTGNASQPFVAKPFYTAALTLQQGLGASDAFSGRVTASSAPSVPATDVFVLQFANASGGVAFGGWTNSTSCATWPAVPSRQDCGFDGIGPDECAARRCCWNPNEPGTGGPQCFFGSAPTAPLSVSFPSAPAPAGTCWDAVDMLGAALGTVCASAAGVVTLGLSPSPSYLLPKA